MEELKKKGYFTLDDGRKNTEVEVKKKQKKKLGKSSKGDQDDDNDTEEKKQRGKPRKSLQPAKPAQKQKTLADTTFAAEDKDSGDLDINEDSSSAPALGAPKIHQKKKV